MGKLKSKKIIVTGGTGFIGSHLVEKLMQLQAKVLVIDIENLPRSYFSVKKLHEKVDISFVDVADKKRIAKIFSLFNPDYVVHLAAEAIVNNSYNNPYKTFQTNIMGTVSVLEASRKENVKGIIVASSDKAYGKTKKAYMENSPLQGDHPYDVSKSSADLISQAYYKTYGLPVVIARFGNVYGEGDVHMDRIIPGICESLIKKKVLAIRSDGKYIRDYLYVKDVVEGYLTLLHNLKKIKGEAFNFSSNETYSVLELVRESEKSLQSEIRYKILNIAKNEIPYQHLNDTKIRKLGWKSHYSIKKVLPEILHWYEMVSKK